MVRAATDEHALRASPAARRGVRAAHLRVSALREPRARNRLAGRDGGRALVVPGALAERARHPGALRGDRRAWAAGTVAPVRAANAAHAALGSRPVRARAGAPRSEQHTSELQSLTNLVCRL